MRTKHLLLGAAVSSITLGLHHSANANSFTEALTGGKAMGDIRIRYEGVEQDNALDDATALTMRTRIGYKTGTVNGFSALAEFEDARVIGGIDDYSVPPTGFQTGEYSVIADPEATELDQGFLQYQAGQFTAKIGRQVMVFDNQRFIGHVGWRQDRQSFDGAAFNFKPNENISLSYNYIAERERIFGEEGDVDSKDHLLNGSFKTSIGTVTAYAYLLELDNDTDNSLDTIGVRLAGEQGKISYAAEYASQSAESGGLDADVDYIMGELGVNFGPVTLKGSYELLGSDDGAYGFSTPLATLHKYNGWSDQFLATPTSGLEDIAVSLGGKAGPGKWAVIYHDFSTDESTGADDLGDEINVAYSMKFGKQYNFGVKAAIYSAGDDGTGKVDTDKVWLWVGAKF